MEWDLDIHLKAEKDESIIRAAAQSDSPSSSRFKILPENHHPHLYIPHINTVHTLLETKYTLYFRLGGFLLFI